MKVIPKRYRIRIYSEAVKLLKGEKETAIEGYKQHGFCYLFAFAAFNLGLPDSAMLPFITNSPYYPIQRYPEMKAHKPKDALAYWFPPMEEDGILHRLIILKEVVKNLNNKT